MSQAYVGEVRLVGFNFAPVGWAICGGQQIPISQNETLYNLIGTTYGGDGQSVFNLPNLLGRIPIHQGSNGTNTYTIGQTGGAETVTLVTSQYPAHNHTVMAADSSANLPSPNNNVVAIGPKIYSAASPTTAMSGNMITPSGSSGPHNNLQPFQALNWIIALYGVYPSQS
jgi:microcystin-dependent protein